MDDFLPQGTEIPKGKGENYMKFSGSENRFRILGKALVGWELWINNKPVRNTDKGFTLEQIDGADINKYTGLPRTPQNFWAFPVYNYQEKKVQILEITQTTIMRGIEGCMTDPDYGKDVTQYDFVVVKTGKDRDVEYTVRPKPPKLVSEDILDAYEKVTIDLEAMLRGEDPFAGSSIASKIADETPF